MELKDYKEKYTGYVQAAEEIGSALSGYKSALSGRMGVERARERLKTILFAHADLILPAIRDAREMSEEIVSLMEALEKADKEYDELQKKIPKTPKTSKRSASD